MPRMTISILKFVGTVSLGLLTGISYTASTQSIPALLALPSSHTANTSFQAHKDATKQHLTNLFAVSVTSYTLAFYLSPPRGGRHPYLLWTSLVSAIGWGAATYILRTGRSDDRQLSGGSIRVDDESEGYIDAAGSSGSPSESDVWALNGEEVRKSMERWRLAETVRASVCGIAFTMAIVGLWGDRTAIM